jgi:hypothetical protein
VRANKLFQTLLQCMVGLKFTIPEEGNQLQLSILYKSSGYSFKLKYPSVENDPHLKKNGEPLYHTVSLGTLQKIAPAWIKKRLRQRIKQRSLYMMKWTSKCRNYSRPKLQRAPNLWSL